MKKEKKGNIVFILYLIVILTLAIVYFTVPERAEIIRRSIDWWSQLLNMIL